MQFFATGERIAYFEVACIGQPDDVAGISFVDHRFLLCHECRGTRKAHHLVTAHMLIIGISFEFSRTYFYEGNTTAMIGIHVGVYLEYEPCEVFLFGSDDSFYRLNGFGRRCYFHKAIEQFFYSEHI